MLQTPNTWGGLEPRAPREGGPGKEAKGRGGRGISPLADGKQRAGPAGREAVRVQRVSRASGAPGRGGHCAGGPGCGADRGRSDGTRWRSPPGNDTFRDHSSLPLHDTRHSGWRQSHWGGSAGREAAGSFHTNRSTEQNSKDLELNRTKNFKRPHECFFFFFFF